MAADTGTTNWPANTDDLNLPSDMTLSPLSAGDGHYTFKQWLERVTGMLRATATDLLTAMTHDLPMGSHKITGLATPSASTDAATKAYVDATAQGLSVKPSVKGASTTNHSVSAFSGSTIDGGSVSLSANDRILLKDQSTASENGPWVFNGAGSALTRPADFAHGAQEAGAFVFVESGTANANRGYVLSGTAITVDTTAQTWVQFSGAGEITAGTGLTKTGDTINAVANADGTIVANADDLQVGTLVAGNVPTGLITSAMVADGTLVNADINAAAAIVYSKLTLTGSVVNADINAAAAIASSKLADGSLITGAVQKSTLTAKGSFYIATGASAPAEHAAGNDGETPVWDSSATDGTRNAVLNEAKRYNDLLGWTSDPTSAMNSTILSAAATAFFCRIPLLRQISLTNVIAILSANGVALTHAFVQAWKSDGTVIGRSQDYSSNWVSAGATLDGNTGGTGTKTIPLASGPFTVTPLAANDFIWVGAYVGTAGTLPSFARPAGFTTASVNAGCTTARTRVGQFAIADSATPGAITPASITQMVNPYWFGIS